MSLLLKALRGEKLERYPVWLMRQAGRYLDEYKEVRKKHKNFLDFCKAVDDAVKVSLQPREILGVDAVIMFSDILVVLEPMGIKVEFEEQKGPKLFYEDLSSLNLYDTKKELSYVYDIISSLKKLSDVPVIGFGGSPFTLASYVIEKEGSKTFSKTKAFMYKNHESFNSLMKKLSDTLIDYFVNQAKAGADLIQIFDSWSYVLSLEDYIDFVFDYVDYIINSVKKQVNIPIIYFFRGSSHLFEKAKDLNADCFSIDWTISLEKANSLTDRALQGNLEPEHLYEDDIEKLAYNFLRCIPRKTKFIVNLGHGLLPDLPRSNVINFVKAVKNYKI